MARAATDEHGAGPRGRPRDDDKDAVILDAVARLIGEVGVERLRLQDVAERAGVGLATIYRRWPTKQDLLRAAIASFPLPAARLTGNVRKDLVRYLRDVSNLMQDQQAELYPSIIAMARDPHMAASIREHGFDQVNSALAAILGQVPGRAAADLRRRAMVGPALLMYRVVFVGEEPTDRLIAEVADAVLDGLTG